jgi:hypothetical protein
MVAEACREAPVYAIPRRFLVVPETDLVRCGLLTGNGRIRRIEIMRAYQACPGSDAAVAGGAEQ